MHALYQALLRLDAELAHQQELGARTHRLAGDAEHLPDIAALCNSLQIHLSAPASKPALPGQAHLIDSASYSLQKSKALLPLCCHYLRLSCKVLA